MRVIHCNAWLAGGVVGHSHSEATALRAGLYRDNNKKGLGAGRSGEAEAEASKAAAIRSAQRADKLAAQLDSAQHAAADQSCLTKELQADIPHPHVYFSPLRHVRKNCAPWQLPLAGVVLFIPDECLLYVCRS